MENQWIGAWFIIKKIENDIYDAIHYYYVDDNCQYEIENIERIRIFNKKDNLINIKERNLNSFYLGLKKSKAECWEWQKSTMNDGYGQITVDWKNWRVHRLSYSLYYGPIPKDLMVCHSCDNIICANPKHLFIGSNSDNLLDASRKGITSGENSSSNILNFNDIDDMILRINSGYFSDIFDVSDFYNISHYTVRDILKGKTWKNDFNNGLKKYNISKESLRSKVLNSYKGSNHIHSKLTEENVFQIRDLISRGYRCYKIAEKFNVSAVAIQNIKNRKSWKHI